MSTSLSVKKMIALVLTAAAAVASTQACTRAAGAGPYSRATSANVRSHGYPNAVPPILRPARASELTEMRRAEAREGAASTYRLPPSAGYSAVELNTLASEG